MLTSHTKICKCKLKCTKDSFSNIKFPKIKTLLVEAVPGNQMLSFKIICYKEQKFTMMANFVCSLIELMKVKVAQLCLTLFESLDYTVHGIL